MSDEPRIARLSAEQLARYADGFNRSKTLQHFGMELSFPGGTQVEILLREIRPEQRGGLGSDAVNGGVLAAVFDVTLGCAAALIDPTRRSATIHLSMNFERAVRGSSLRGIGQIDTAGESVLFASARILDERGRACAHAQGVIRMSRSKWKGGESPAVY
jgi:uncharacterized protein (TIGR00369 family)